MAVSLRSLERRVARLPDRDAVNRLKELVTRFKGKPVEYIRDHLGRVTTPGQQSILAALDSPPYRVLVRSANTQGKTAVAAMKCSHFFDTVTPSITLATAPTAKSVTDLLFKELRILRPGDKRMLPKAPRLQQSPDHYVDGYTSNDPDAFQGRHGAALGIVFDEATGIDGRFWGRAETMFESTGQHWWLASYNPNDSASPAFAAEESGGWSLVVLSALEHPNVLAELRGEPPPIPAAIRLDTVLRRMADANVGCDRVPDGMQAAGDFEFPAGSGVWWRPKSPEFEAQILGRWPITPTAALFSPFLAERCCQLKYTLNPAWQLAVGVDCARYGDDKTTIVVRCGPVLLRCEAWSAVSTTWIAERVRTVIGEVVRELGVDPATATTIPVYIDDTGGYGAGVIDQAEGYAFHGLCMSASSPDPRYGLVRSYLWCELAAIAVAGGLDLSRLPAGERQTLCAELTTPRYSLDSKGRRVVEPKSQIKERLRRSPDRADAVCLAYYGAA